MEWFDYVLLGIQAVFQGPSAFSIIGIAIPIAVVMVISGFLVGILVGSTPGLAGPMAMAISLPILISVFGYHESALLPVFGFLIGIMKGATVGGAVPAILFNTPGTPDAYMTTLDGYPMAQRGQAHKALRVAHFSSVSGDTFSDIVLILCAPFLAVLVERYLDLPEKTALLLMTAGSINPEMVVAFGLFTMMMLANSFNWLIGGRIMRAMGVMTRVPKHYLLPVILLLTLTSIYIQETRLVALWFTIGFGFLGYFMRRIDMSPLPFVIAFILGGRLEDTARQAFSATGSDLWFLFSSLTSAGFMGLCFVILFIAAQRRSRQP